MIFSKLCNELGNCNCRSARYIEETTNYAIYDKAFMTGETILKFEVSTW